MNKVQKLLRFHLFSLSEKTVGAQHVNAHLPLREPS